MRKEFLRQVAETYIKNEGSDLTDYCFVFPNRRSSLFFKKYLGLSSDRPIFSPELVTISSLFSSISGLVTESKVSLLFYLYKVFQKVTGTQESFDEFIFKGDTILNDYDDIDKYLVDAQMLFTNIADLKEIGGDYSFLTDKQREAIEKFSAFQQFWDTLIKNKDGENEKSFTDLWKIMYEIYSSFRESLRNDAKAYEGMVYRDVIDKLSDKSLSLDESFPKTRYVFVGFNALNNCEKKLLNILRDSGKGDFYWDYYGSIIKDKMNMSSFFMDDNVKIYPPKYDIDDDRASEIHEQHFESIAIPSGVGQAKYVTTLLEELFPEGSTSKDDRAFNTAIVLPDENLLMPLLNSIPKNIESINVTMGYSLSNSSAAVFINLLGDLFTKIKTTAQGMKFYHLPVLGLLRHPYLKIMFHDDIEQINKRIVDGNMAYVSPEILQVNDFFKLLFNESAFLQKDKVEALAEIINYEKELLLQLQSFVSGIDREFIYQYYLTINSIESLGLEIFPKTFFKLQQQLVSTVAIPFKGEPLAGLQIMGPLETRALDFENLIILSVNEGTFPKKGVSTSLIPYNLRQGFSLPNYEFQDAIAAYHFYRNIYRAKNIYLLHDSRTFGMVAGEESRFIKQLKYHHNVDMTEKVLSFGVEKRIIEPIVIEKNEAMIDKIFAKNFSASGLDTYISCPLKFYYQVVEGRREEDEVTEEVFADKFGSMYHNVMEWIYTPFVGKYVSKEDLAQITTDQINLLIGRAFEQVMKLSVIEGYNKVTAALILRYVQKTLEVDMKMTPFKFIDTEKKVYYKLDSAELSRPMNFYGIIDRLDSKEGMIRVVDYKTGGVSMNYASVADIFSGSHDKRPYTAFQLFFYIFILIKKGVISSPESITATIYSLKTIFKSPNPEMMVTNEAYKEFEESLYALINEIANLSIPFKGCDDDKYCSYCPFKVNCNK